MTSRGLQRLSEDECRAYLTSSRLGRIGLRIGESPAILPINYAMLDGDVVFRTDPGSKLTAAVMGVQVAFEIDGEASESDVGWSVLVVGHRRRSATRRPSPGSTTWAWSPGSRATARTSFASPPRGSPGAESLLDGRRGQRVRTLGPTPGALEGRLSETSCRPWSALECSSTTSS